MKMPRWWYPWSVRDIDLGFCKSIAMDYGDEAKARLNELQKMTHAQLDGVLLDIIVKANDVDEPPANQWADLQRSEKIAYLLWLQFEPIEVEDDDDLLDALDEDEEEEDSAMETYVGHATWLENEAAKVVASAVARRDFADVERHLNAYGSMLLSNTDLLHTLDEHRPVDHVAVLNRASSFPDQRQQVTHDFTRFLKPRTHREDI